MKVKSRVGRRWWQRAGRQSKGDAPTISNSGIPRRWSILWEGEERLPERDSLFLGRPQRVLGLLAFAMYVTLAGCAQKQNDGGGQATFSEFVGIRLGESVTSATEKMLAKEGVSMESDTADYVFRGGELLGVPVDRWVLSFWQGEHFWYINVEFKVDSSSSARTYDSMRLTLLAQYGKPSNEIDARDSAVKAVLWRDGSAGTDRSNVISLTLIPEHRLALHFEGFRFVDTLEMAHR